MNIIWCTFKFLDGLNYKSKGENNGRRGVGARSLARSTSGVKERVGAPGWGLGRLTSKSIIHTDLHKPNNKLISVQLKHFLCMDESQANTYSQDSPWHGLGGSHHLPPYSILCLAMGPTPKCHFVLGFPSGNPEIPNIRIPTTLEARNFVHWPSIEVRSKAKL
jgi:hypothetical protein